jgi:tellurite resistance protein
MGYKYNYDITSAILEVNKASRECCDSRVDGYIAFGIKQDLYRLKWILDAAIKRCSTFSGEEEWLREQEKQRVIRILKDEE